MNPSELFSSRKGLLSVGGIAADKIIGKTGTPVYIYDAAIMRARYKKLESAIPAGTYIHYSLKANPNPAVAKVFSGMGAGAEVASGGELSIALKAGFNPGRVLFAGPGKSEEDLKLAVRSGIGSINVESETELYRVMEIAERTRTPKSSPVRISFRVNLDFRDGHSGEVMIGGPRKFGIDDDALEPLVLRAMSDKRVEPVGFHCFAGTQITDTGTLASAYRRFAEWAVGFAQGLDLEVRSLNFGGGLGIPFSETERELDVRRIGSALEKIRNLVSKSRLFRKTRFLLEPGRYLVGPSGVYVTRVIDLKTSRGQLYVITDGGIHHALIPIVLNKNYPSAIINKMGKRRTVDCVVAGPLCASADQFSRRLKLPRPEIGDYLGVFNSGAYGYTAGMLFFLSHPTPSEALVDNGEARLIRASERPGGGISRKLRI